MYTGAVTVFDREQGQNYTLVSKVTSFVCWLFFFFFFLRYTTAALWYRKDIYTVPAGNYCPIIKYFTTEELCSGLGY